MDQRNEPRCPNCGAPLKRMMPKCPYCGHICEEGAEKQFMQELEETRQQLDKVDDEARAGYRQEWKRNSLSAFRKILLAAAVIAAIAGLFIWSERRLYRNDPEDYVHEMAWQHEHFMELDELYEAGKYEEARNLLYKYSGEGHNMWDWKYHDELMGYTQKGMDPPLQTGEK